MIEDIQKNSISNRAGISKPYAYDYENKLNPGILRLNQMLHENFFFLMEQIGEIPSYHGKQWQYLQIMTNSLKISKKNNKTALGFGVGLEPIPAFLVKNGFKVTATDFLDGDNSNGWNESGQLMSDFNKLNDRRIVDDKSFEANCKFLNLDMNDIHRLGKEKFDFIWSTCALGHIGSYDKGLDFIVNTSRLLKRGGIAVHTTELDLTNLEPFNTPGLSLYKLNDLIKLIFKLSKTRNLVVPEHDLRLGTSDVENFTDEPPYSKVHLRIKVFDREVLPFSIVFSRKSLRSKINCILNL